VKNKTRDVDWVGEALTLIHPPVRNTQLNGLQFREINPASRFIIIKYE